MRVFHCTWALTLALALGSPAGAAQDPGSQDETHGFIVFMRGVAVGREDVTIRTDAAGVVISGRGRISPPLDLIIRRAEVRYRANWTPESLLIEGTQGGGEILLKTTFAGTEAQSEATERGKVTTKTDTVSADTLVVPNMFLGTYAAMTRRLTGAMAGDEFPAYVAPQSEVRVSVRAIRRELVQTGAATFAVRRYDLAIPGPGGDLPVSLVADEAGHLIRLSVPSQGLDLVREDVAASTSRTVSHANPGDEPVTIPANGFNMAGTVTLPANAPGPLPAVVLVAGGAGDRDGLAGGVPIMGQLAGALADAGFLVLRYDRRGYGQSGGRAEAATLSDFGEDVRTIVRYVAKRKDVDSKRIAIVGHAEGAAIALQAGSREGRVEAIVSLAGSASTGTELVLEQQRLALAELPLSDADRQAKVDLQEQINAAVISGEGWEGVPRDIRLQADTPWFQSLLTYDPTKVIKKVDQPLLIVHGDLDRQVPVAHATRLAELARTVGDSTTVELATFPGLSHELVAPPSSGENAVFAGPAISPDVTRRIADWLIQTLAARR